MTEDKQTEAVMVTPRPRTAWAKFAGTLALGAMVGSVTTFGLFRLFPAAAPAVADAPRYTTRVVGAAPLVSGNAVPEIYRKVVSSVVTVSVEVQQGFYQGTSTGSGFVVDPAGYILTNYHVIDGGTSVKVNFVDGTSLAAKIIGTDRVDDLAVLKVEAGGPLNAVKLGDSDAVQVGELAVAIGSPYDNEFTVTAGIVSALHRTIEEENNPVPIPDAIQTDAAINPGNSGGPLLNGSGEVIGINTAINSPVRGSVGLGFAIPVNAAKRLLPSLMAGKQIEFGWMGVTLDDLTADLARRLGTSVTQGAIVVDVIEGSPAAKGGLVAPSVTRSGRVLSADVITAVDGTAVKNAHDLIQYVAGKRAGDIIVLTVLRGKNQLSLTVVLVAPPSDQSWVDPYHITN